MSRMKQHYEARSEAIEAVMRSEPVRRKLAQVADRLAQGAAGVAQSENVAVPITRDGGVRPKGRPYERISIPASHEHGDSKTRRLRILGRAVQAGSSNGRRR